MSGDTDICWAGTLTPTMDEREAIMQQIPGIRSRGGGKNWSYAELWIDLLGEIDYLARKEFAIVETPFGEVLLIPVEDALVGRVYAARRYVSGYDEKDDDCAKKLMSAVLSGSIPIDWEEAQRVAVSSKFNCLEEFNAVKEEVKASLANSGP